MRIHNLYSDILRSLIFLFESIFGENYIKRYIFNIGNYSFQIDYETQKEYPVLITNLEASIPINLHPTNIQRIGLSNINRIPVIYNRTKDLTIELQEDFYYITITMMLNCESQFQAKDAEFRIQSMLPLNKWIYAYDFTSFLEIDPVLLSKDILDIDSHDLVNVYRLFDYSRATNIVTFAVNYKPLIRLTDISTTIENVAEFTSAVNFTIEYLIQFPQYLFIPYIDRPQSDREREFIFENIFVNISDYEILYIELNNNDYALFLYDSDEISNRTFNAFNLDYLKCSTRRKVVEAKVEWISDQFSNILLDTSINVKIIDNKYVEFGGILTGKLDIVKQHDNLIGGVFDGTYMSKPITRQYMEFKYIELLSYLDIYYEPKTNFKYIRVIPRTRKLLSLIPYVNENKVDLDTNRTILKSIVCLDLSSRNLYEIPADKTFENNIIIFSINEDYTLKIYYDSNAKLLDSSITKLNDNISYVPIALKFSPVYITAKPTYGGTFIERINVALDYSEFPISCIFPVIDDETSYAIPEQNPYKQIYRTIFRYIADSINSSDENYYIFEINTNPIDLTKYNDIKFRITNRFHKYDFSQKFDQDPISYTYTQNLLFLNIDKIYFLKYFRNISKLNPLFVEILSK